MNKRGFTLIELLLVIAIISIVSTIVSLRFNFVDKTKANIELQTIINDIDYAKMKAISSGETASIEFSPKSYKIWARKGGIQSVILTRDFTNVGFTYSMTNNRITFRKSGTVANPGTIKIQVSKGMDQTYIKELTVRVGDGNVRYKD